MVQQPQPQPQVQVQVQAPQDDMFTQRRMELMIDMATKKLLAEIQQLKQSMQKLETEVADLRKRGTVMSVSSASPQAVLQSAPQRPVSGSGMNDFSPQKKVSADVPRYGHYTSEDVSVEKFFNFGSGGRRK